MSVLTTPVVGQTNVVPRFWPQVLLLAAIGVGAVLRTWQYLADSSLWIDELALANNVMGRRAAELLSRPLDFAQVAPPGFVVALKTAAWLGGSERHLRLYAFVCGLASLVLTARLAKKILGDHLSWAPTLLVAMSPLLIFQAAQVKPYSGDCLLVLACLLLAVRMWDATEPCEPWRWGTLGALAPWFSFPALFAVAAVGLAALRSATARERRPSAAALGALSAIAASGIAVLALSSALVSAATRAYMDDYWAHGFPTIPPKSLADLAWPFSATTDLLQTLGVGDFRGAGTLTLVAMIGAIHLVRRQGMRAALLVLPLAAAFAAAVLRQYPLSGRVAVWTAPLMDIFVVAGVAALLGRAPHSWRSGMTTVALAALVAIPVLRWVQRPFPQRVEHVRPLLQQLVRDSRPGDAVYVYHGAWQAWTYYAPRLGASGLTVAMGGCSRADRGLPLTELQSLAGRDRVWIVISHANQTVRERGLIADFLARIGARLIREGHQPTPLLDASTSASVLLYDLSGVRAGNDEGSQAVAAALDATPGDQPRCEPPSIPPGLDRSPAPLY